MNNMEIIAYLKLGLILMHVTFVTFQRYENKFICFSNISLTLLYILTLTLIANKNFYLIVKVIQHHLQSIIIFINISL